MTYNKNKVISVSAVVIIIFVAIAFYYVLGPKGGPSSALLGGGQTQSNTGTGQILQSSQYAQFAYKIYPGTLDAQAQSALTGFTMHSSTLANGTAEMNLTVNNIVVAKVLVPQGDSLYFIETAFGDDFSNYDSSLGDDGIILVNQAGYIM